MGEGIGLAEALLGLDGFRVLEVTETAAEVVIGIETTADAVGCGAVVDAAPGPSPRTAWRWRSGTWPASVARHGW